MGTGSENQAKKRAWAIIKETRGQPLVPKPKPEPAPPKFSQETRDIIARLVSLGRADLICAVLERKISPSAAARIAAARGERRAAKALGVSHQTVGRDLVHDGPESGPKRATKAERGAEREREPEAEKKPAPTIDEIVRAMIA